jgi:hypothetical protein
MTHNMTPTERQAAIIADLEARITLLTDDLFYARASVARMTVELEQAKRQLEHRDAEIAMLRATSDKSDDKPAERPTYETLERENAALRKDKERMDWLEKHLQIAVGHIKWGEYRHYLCHGKNDDNLRAAIDAARKEAQPCQS